MGAVTEEQLDLFIPVQPKPAPRPKLPTGEGDCPGYDKCPISMCGCRWLGLGTPWRDNNERPDDDGKAGNSAE